MTTTLVSETAPPTRPAADPMDRAGFSVSIRTFGAVLWRDVFVTGRELLPFLAQVIIQPFFMLFIFGKVLGGIGYVDIDKFAPVLLAGIIALNGFLGGLQNTMMPLVMDFSFTREIEDRLLAPMPVPWVAVEKIVFGALRGMISALIMVPVGLALLPTVHWPASSIPPVVGIVVLGSLLGASIGLMLGTLVPPRRINIMFAVILTPLMFTGSTQFPWHSLTSLRWFQVVCAINPLTYISEAMRSVLIPSLPSIPLWLDILVAAVACVAVAWIGIWGFLRRAID
jgi:ABC-2 type transport system permease protein